MQKRKKKSGPGRGGARPGAGRKASGRSQIKFGSKLKSLSSFNPAPRANSPRARFRGASFQKLIKRVPEGNSAARRSYSVARSLTIDFLMVVMAAPLLAIN